jgi:hypothetical protein
LLKFSREQRREEKADLAGIREEAGGRTQTVQFIYHRTQSREEESGDQSFSIELV